MDKLLKNGLMLTVAILLVSCFAISSCSYDDNDESNQGFEEMIVGKWICYYDAYGDYWDEPLIYQFDSDGTGYEWFQDEPFSDRIEFMYSITESKIRFRVEYETYNIRYELSSSGKSLVLYGLDDDDMRELHFVKQ